MKLFATLCCVIAMNWSSQSLAVTILSHTLQADSTVSSVSIGDTFNLDISLIDLLDFQGVGVYDFDLGYDSNLFALSDYEFSNALDASGLGDFSFLIDDGAGELSIGNLSFDSAADLLTHQQSLFLDADFNFNVPLLSLQFTALSQGEGDFGFNTVHALGDQFGNPFDGLLLLSGFTITVTDDSSTDVSAPAGLAWVALGLLAVCYRRQMPNRQ